MGEIIRVLVLDKDSQRVEQIRENLASQDPYITLDHTTDLISFIHLVETNSYDCVLAPEADILSKTELMSKIIEILKAPRLTYLGETRFPESTHQTPEPIDALGEENSISHKILAERIRNAVSKKTSEESYLPEHPKVVVRGHEIFIVNDDGSETSWGQESIDEIHRIAESLDKELRSIQWVREEIERCISEITMVLSYSGIPDDGIAELIFEGYRSVLVKFKRFDDSFNT